MSFGRWRCRLLPALGAILLLTLAACLDDGRLEQRSVVEASLVATLSSAEPADGRLGEAQAAVHTFYARRGFTPVWSGSADAGARGQTLRETLAAADREGLEPRDYLPADPANDADLSLALLRYAQDVGRGRTEERAADLGRTLPDGVEILSAAAAAPDLAAWLAALPPRSVHYGRLRSLLAELRATAARGGWTRVAAEAKLDRQSEGPVVQRLRQRLVESDDLTADLALGNLFDAAVEQAVVRFQLRHGLTADGVVGATTLAALAVPVEQRIEQVLVNMERRRHLPTELGRRYVLVNVADFEVELLESEADGSERTIFTSPVVVGTAYHQTPIFADEITHVIVNPYWHVPRSIVVDELLPEMRRDPEWLARNRYTLWTTGDATRRVDPATVDWSTMGRRSFPYLVRQEPGDHNALGRIKIIFPNQFDVYMHDTPQKSLFGRASRTFSHGCIRVGKPFELAALLLAPRDISLDDLLAMKAGRANRTIRLAEPVPVHITYFTAFVDEDGTAQFRADPYDRDRAVLEALSTSRS